MGDNRDSYLVKALLDNYEEPLDISLISNNPFIPSIGNNLNTPTNQNNEKRHLLPESTPNLPPTLNNKTPAKSKSIQELESFIDQKCNELALGSLKRDAEIKQQISDELEAYYNTSLVKSLKDQIDILQSEVYFLREELREKNNLFKILMKSKISDNKCHNIDTNNKNDKIPESAPSELRYTTTNKNNHKNISKNENDEKINENINNSMANTINFDSGNENNKNNSNKNKGNYINSNEGNNNNNNNSSSKERNMSSSNINSKINIKNINDNSKENNMNSNGGDNSTNSKQKQASNNTNSIINNNNNGNSKENNISSSNINSKTRKTAFIIGDSMVKKIDGYLLTSSINHRYIVKVRPFLSAKTIDMVDYIKPTQRDFNPDVYLLHVGTNDLSSNKSPEQISLDILNLANSLKLDNNTVIVSSIVPRDDENKKKVDEVNTILEKLCKANNVGIISHRNINPKRHLNRSRLHWNNAGVSLFVRNFRDFLNNFDKI